VRIRPKMERVTFTDLSEAEQLLWEAFPRGAWVDLGRVDVPAEGLADAIGPDPARIIRAEVVGALLLGAVKVDAGWAAGIRLRGAVIIGQLDLASASVAWPLACERCWFDSEIGFAECSVKSISVVDSQLPGFNGTRMRLDGILDLRGSAISGTVRLEHAKVTGQLRMREAKVGTASAGAIAVSASGLAVDGDLDAFRLEAHGAVAMSSAAITGSVDLAGARITCPAQQALVMDYAVVGGKLDCRQIIVEGEFRILNSSVTAMILMNGARLDNPGEVALSGGGLTADGGVFLTDGFAAKGELRLVGARLAANLTMTSATFDNPGGVAVNLERASIASCHGTGLTCKGQLNLTSARISGDLDFTGAALETGNSQPALLGQRAQIDGKLVLSGIKAQGEVDLRTVKVGASLLLNGAQLCNPAGSALRMSRAQVAADMFCYEMTAAGRVGMGGITIGGSIILRQVRLSHPPGIALDAPDLQARQLVMLPAVPIEGAVDLSDASVGVLRDDPGSWPAQLSLDGLTYETLDPQLPARQRLQWLARDPRGHQPRTYEQLAAHYNAIGQQAQARAVLYAREQIQRQGKAPFYRAWSLLQDITVGYGYRPRRALAWLALLLTAGSIVFSVAPPPALQPSMAPHFNGIIYTIDLMLPVVNLGQKYAFDPGGTEQWLSYFLIAAGWTLATTVAAGAARILRRG
jgi:cytoskeletal protein CcmA (bactofilin family)